MKAVGYRQSHPLSHPESLQDITLPEPVAQGSDVLVEVMAISVNPVDTKVRAHATPPAGEWKVLGWDAAGIVRAVGPDVRGFKEGDRVWYAGSLTRPGTNSQLHLVDERIVAHMPETLSFAEAAALPLTSITAWELLFDRFSIADADGGTILIVGAAGGVGSILVQLARALTRLTIIGTASRPASKEWVQALGAHHVIDHGQAFGNQLSALGMPEVDFVASLTHTDAHLQEIAGALRPQGKLGLIDDPSAFDIGLIKRKSISLHWEFMFTRSMFDTQDVRKQGQLLADVARLVDAGRIKTTMTENYGRINAANLKRAHAFVESGRALGKVVLEGF